MESRIQNCVKFSVRTCYLLIYIDLIPDFHKIRYCLVYNIIIIINDSHSKNTHKTSHTHTQFILYFFTEVGTTTKVDSIIVSYSCTNNPEPQSYSFVCWWWQCTSTVHKYQASQETITSHYFTYLFKRCPHFTYSIYFNSHITNISWSKDKNNISSSDTCCCPTVIQIAPSKYFIQMCSNKRTTIKKFQKLTSIYPYHIL